MSGDAESTVESPVAEPPIAEEEITPEPNPDAPICEEPPQAAPCTSAVAGPSEGNLAPADSACAADESDYSLLKGRAPPPLKQPDKGRQNLLSCLLLLKRKSPSLQQLRRQNRSRALPLNPIQLQGRFSMLPARRMHPPHIPAQLAG